MIRPTPIYTRTDTLLPYTTLFRSETGEGDAVHAPLLAVVEQSDNQAIVADRHARERSERDPVLLHRADAVVLAEAAHPRGVARIAQRQQNTAVLGHAGRIGPVEIGRAHV